MSMDERGESNELEAVEAGGDGDTLSSLSSSTWTWSLVVAPPRGARRRAALVATSKGETPSDGSLAKEETDGQCGFWSSCARRRFEMATHDERSTMCSSSSADGGVTSCGDVSSAGFSGLAGGSDFRLVTGDVGPAAIEAEAMTADDDDAVGTVDAAVAWATAGPGTATVTGGHVATALEAVVVAVDPV